MTIVDIKILDARLDSLLPAYATPGSAGLDFSRSPQVMPSIVIVQGQFAVISADGILGKIRSE